MRKTYVLTGQAKKDLDEINEFIAEDDPQAANRFLDAFAQKSQMLVQFPEIGRCWDDIVPPLRSFPLGKYLIFYRPIQEGVEIVRILSGYRDFEAIFPELGDS
jgi:toxin ParE1/3/4